MIRPTPRSTLFPYTTLFRSRLRPHRRERLPRPRRRRAVRRACSGERSEEHTSELQSHVNLVCRLLLEKKKDVETQLNHLHCPRLRDYNAIYTLGVLTPLWLL